MAGYAFLSFSALKKWYLLQNAFLNADDLTSIGQDYQKSLH